MNLKTRWLKRAATAAGISAALFLSFNATADDLIYFEEDGGGGGPRGLYDFDSTTGNSNLRAGVGGNERFFSMAIEPGTGTVWGIEPLGNTIYTIDIDSGATTYVSTTVSDTIADITFDPFSREMYGLGRNSQKLYTIDHLTGASTYIGTTSATRCGLTFAPDGTLYGFTTDGVLYEVDPVERFALWCSMWYNAFFSGRMPHVVWDGFAKEDARGRRTGGIRGVRRSPV